MFLAIFFVTHSSRMRLIFCFSKLRISMSCHGFSKGNCQVSWGFTRFQGISLGVTEFVWVLLRLQWVFLGFKGFHWVSMGFTGFQGVFQGVSLGVTGFYWVLLDFT